LHRRLRARALGEEEGHSCRRRGGTLTDTAAGVGVRVRRSAWTIRAHVGRRNSKPVLGDPERRHPHVRHHRTPSPLGGKHRRGGGNRRRVGRVARYGAHRRRFHSGRCFDRVPRTRRARVHPRHTTHRKHPHHSMQCSRKRRRHVVVSHRRHAQPRRSGGIVRHPSRIRNWSSVRRAVPYWGGKCG